MQIKEILYSVGIKHIKTEKEIKLEVWAENCHKATGKVTELINYDGQYRWTGTSPLYKDNEVISRSKEKSNE